MELQKSLKKCFEKFNLIDGLLRKYVLFKKLYILDTMQFIVSKIDLSFLTLQVYCEQFNYYLTRTKRMALY